MRVRIPLLIALLFPAVGAVLVRSLRVCSDASVELSPELPGEAREARGLADELREPAAEAEREPVGEEIPAAETAAEQLAEPVTLTVVEAATGEPVAGAEVFTATFQELEWGKRLRAHGNPDPEALLRELGRSFTSDEQGKVELERFDDDYLVCARRGELFRFARWHELQTEEGRLPLFRDRDLAIEVVDATGTPCAGVLVVLDELRTSHRLRLWSAQTSALGIARLRHVLGEAANWRHHVLGEAEVFATFGFPVADAPRVPLTLDDPPSEPIRLVLPPTGELAVRAEREDGEPLAKEVVVRLRRAESETAPSGVWGSSFLEQEVFTEHGVASFPFVGLDLELEVESLGPGGCESMELHAVGPTRPGERVELLLRHPLFRRPTLTGRVVRPDGSPVANADLMYLTRAARRNPRLDQESDYDVGDLETDAEGHFELTLWPIEAEVVTLYAREYVEYRLRAEAVAPLPSPLQPGSYDLGELVLEDAPLIVSGRVVDEQGNPVEALLKLKRKEYEDESGEDWFWDLFGHFRGPGHEDGSFEVRGALEPGEYGIYAESKGYEPGWPLPFTPGQTDLRVVLRKATIQYLRGSVLLDEGIPGGLLVAREWPPGDEESWPKELYFSDRLHFCAALAAGPHEVGLFLHGRIPLIEPVTVHVEPDTICEPPALQEIDLRGRLHPLTLRVEDGEGHGLDAWVTVGAAGGVGRTFGQPVGEGDVRLVTPWPESDLRVSAPGFRSLCVARASGECRVTLRAGLAVQLDLSALPALPPDCTLEVRLSRAEPDRWDRPLHGERIGEWVESVVPTRVLEDELAFLVPAIGEWRVEWVLEWETEEDWGSMVLGTPPRRVTLEDCAEVQRFEIDPPTAALVDAALAELRR